MCVRSYGVCQICPSSSAPAAPSRLRTSELPQQLGSWLRPREQEPAGTSLSDRSGQKWCILGSYRISRATSKTLWSRHLRWLNSCVEFSVEMKNKIASTCSGNLHQRGCVCLTSSCKTSLPPRPCWIKLFALMLLFVFLLAEKIQSLKPVLGNDCKN